MGGETPVRAIFMAPIGEDVNPGHKALYAVFRFRSCRFSQVMQPGPAALIRPRNVTAAQQGQDGEGGWAEEGVESWPQ